jgi:multiple sugar transport system ATP-binding protein
VNRFVASFIGSPAMNFVEGKLEDGAFVGAGFTAPLVDRLAPARSRTGPAVLGIRPEDLELVGEADGSDGGPGTVIVTARVVEPMGNEIFLHSDFEGGYLLARIGPQILPKIGIRYRLKLDSGRAHLFDPASGASLLHHDPVAAEA